MNPLALLRTLRAIVATILVAALLVLAGHFLWPKAPDPRAVALEPRLTAFRGQVAALQHDTTRLGHTRDSLIAVTGRHYRVGRDITTHVIAGLDSLGVVACHDSLDLRPFADSLRYAVVALDASHTADSLALNAADSLNGVLASRLTVADSLIAQAAPIVHDAARPAKVWRWFAAGAGVAIVVLRVVR